MNLKMLSDGTFEEIAKRWGLEESVCLSADDKYIDSTDTSTTNDDFWQQLGQITVQLLEGLLATLTIFVLTLLFSLPLGLLVAAGRMCKIAPIR